MSLFAQLSKKLFWIPLLLVVSGILLSLYYDAQTRPGHIGESAAINAGLFMMVTLLIAIICGIVLLFRRVFIAGSILVVFVLAMAFHLFF